eukprot:6188039-Pleurochrysis_carterae.AAC.1
MVTYTNVSIDIAIRASLCMIAPACCCGAWARALRLVDCFWLCNSLLAGTNLGQTWDIVALSTCTSAPAVALCENVKEIYHPSTKSSRAGTRATVTDLVKHDRYIKYTNSATRLAMAANASVVLHLQRLCSELTVARRARFSNARVYCQSRATMTTGRC